MARGAAVGTLAARLLWRADRGLAPAQERCAALGVVLSAADRRAVAADVSGVRAHALPQLRRRLRQHPHHAQQSPGALADVEPALSRRASPVSQHRLLSPARSSSPSSTASEARRQGLHRGPARNHAVLDVKTSEGVFDCGDVSLQRGGTLKGARIVYKTFGTLAPGRDNVIVYPTSYSAQHSDIEWLVAPQHCLDPSRYFIVIPNMFTNGLSSSPSNYDGEFPQVTTYDGVTQQRRLLNEVFGVDRLKMVYGWSMGAQQAYHWAALFGDVVERIVVNCGSAKTAPHNIVFLEGVRAALLTARTPEDGLRTMGRIYAGWGLSQ